jgi:hypothetical protein
MFGGNAPQASLAGSDSMNAIAALMKNPDIAKAVNSAVALVSGVISAATHVDTATTVAAVDTGKAAPTAGKILG